MIYVLNPWPGPKPYMLNDYNFKIHLIIFIYIHSIYYYTYLIKIGISSYLTYVNLIKLINLICQTHHVVKWIYFTLKSLDWIEIALIPKKMIRFSPLEAQLLFNWALTHVLHPRVLHCQQRLLEQLILERLVRKHYHQFPMSFSVACTSHCHSLRTLLGFACSRRSVISIYTKAFDHSFSLHCISIDL